MTNLRKRIIPIGFLFVLLYACNLDERKNLPLYQLFPDTYHDIVELDGSVQAVHESTLACPRRLNGTISYLIEDGTLVQEGDTICILSNEELSNEYDNLLSEVEKSKLQLTKGKANIEMQLALLKAQVANNEAQTNIANLSEAQLQYLSPQQQKIEALELKRAAIEKEKISKKLELLERINKSELKKLELRIAQKENRAAKIKDELDELVICSPQNGLATRAISWMTGETIQETDQVWGGMPIVKIPDLTQMKVVIQSPESSYKRLSENDSVVYNFSAMPGNWAWGKILKKAPMGKPISRNSKVKYFEITASIDSSLQLPDLGLSARCKVILSEIKDTVVVPQIAVFDKDSLKVVYVKKGKFFEKREVIFGESSPKKAVVKAGLMQHEVIALKEPGLSLVRKTILLPDSLKENPIVLDTLTQNDPEIIQPKMKVKNVNPQ